MARFRYFTFKIAFQSNPIQLYLLSTLKTTKVVQSAVQKK